MACFRVTVKLGHVAVELNSSVSITVIAFDQTAQESARDTGTQWQPLT